MSEKSIESNMELQQVLARIEQANDCETDAIISAVIRRYDLVYPDWEVWFLSVPKNNVAERRSTVQCLLDHLSKLEGADSRDA